MRLARARLVGVGPLADLGIPLADDSGSPRAITVVLGGAGTGKTSLLAGIASTRPGYAVALPRPRPPRLVDAPFAVTDWILGCDDPSRPHVLRVTSPQATIDEPEEVAVLRKREQALFDRRAIEGGFLLVAISAARWFSRAPVVLSAPDRTVMRYDVRAPSSFDDATRADLARETKQAIAWPTIAAALDPGSERLAAIARAMHRAVSDLTSLGGHRLSGVDPLTLEPTFERDGGDRVSFDELPTAARHLASFGALAVRGLASAYPSLDPRDAEGVVLIDDVALHQEPAVQRALVPTLRRALPGVQWILTTSSLEMLAGCDADEVLALRRAEGKGHVEVFAGTAALVH